MAAMGGSRGEKDVSQDARVDYSVSAFKKAGFVDGGRLMLLTSGNDPAETLDAFRDTVAALGDAWLRLEPEELWIRVNPPSVGPDGPLAYVDNSEPSRALSLMLEQVARGLEERGISGRLKPAPSASSPYFGRLVFPAWNAALRFAEPAPAGGPFMDFSSDPDQTRAALAPLVEWVLQADGSVYVGNGAHFSAPPSLALDILVDSLARTELVWMERTDDHRRRRQLATSRHGWVSLVHYDADRPRLALLGELCSLVDDVAAGLSLGFVRDLSTHAGDEVDLLSRRGQPAPIADDREWNHFDLSIPFESEFVYDAHVHQVLTSAQLGKLRLDTPRWTVHDLGRDRHSVTHREPEAWFDPSPYPQGRRGEWPTGIDPDVLASARDDFKDALLTRDLLARKLPPPAPSDERRRTLALAPRRANPSAPTGYTRHWFDGHLLPTLAAVLLLPVDLESLYAWPGFGSNYAWHVRDDVTRAALQPALDWVLATDGLTTVCGDVVAPQDAAEAFHDALGRDQDYELMTSPPTPDLERSPHNGVLRRVKVASYGMVLVHSHDATRSKRDQLDDLLAVLTAAAPHLTTGFVREVPTRSSWRHDVLVHQKPVTPFGPARGMKPWSYAGFENAAHLESEYVYDAFAAQVLTTNQMARTRLDPSRWEVTEIGRERFAVRSRAPEAWFDDDPRPLETRDQRQGEHWRVLGRRPSPVARTVLDAARADFGEAIMTARTVAAHPPDLPARHRDKLERLLAEARGHQG